MPSYRRSASASDPDSVGELPRDPERGADAVDVHALVQEAEAEAAEAEAMADAARARARAIRLRRQAETAQSSNSGGVEADPDPSEIGTPAGEVGPEAIEVAAPETEAADTATGVEEEAATADEGGPARSRFGWRPRPRVKRVAVALASLCIVAFVVASGYMIWTHRAVAREQHRAAAYAAAARQGVVTLMSLDFTKAKEDVQRIIDNSTGKFRDEFRLHADEFAKAAVESRVVTEVSVSSTAVESMTDDSAVVLVSATSRVTNSTGARQDPRLWRLSVDLAHDGQQIKISKVEFLP